MYTHTRKILLNVYRVCVCMVYIQQYLSFSLHKEKINKIKLVILFVLRLAPKLQHQDMTQQTCTATLNKYTICTQCSSTETFFCNEMHCQILPHLIVFKVYAESFAPSAISLEKCWRLHGASVYFHHAK